MSGNARQTISKVFFVAAILVLVAGTFLSLGGAALAGGPSPAGDQYGQAETRGTLTPPSGQQQTAGAQTQVSGGTLPNTGVSLLVTGVAGLSLIGAGVLVRRGGRQQRD
jgi:LPXTG-motif cell wall-anchored protein